MLQSLAMNKVKFVRLFDEIGVSINSILTKDNLSFLYFYAYHHSEDSILKEINPDLPSEEDKPCGSNESISDKECLNKRIDLKKLKTFVTEIVCTNTVRNDISSKNKELKSSKVKPCESIEFISYKECRNKRMNLKVLKKYVSEVLYTDTLRDDISFFEVS